MFQFTQSELDSVKFNNCLRLPYFFLNINLFFLTNRNNTDATQ